MTDNIGAKAQVSNPALRLFEPLLGEWQTTGFHPYFPDTDLLVIGSGNLVQTLLKNDLVDEMRLMIFPITLGTGKRLFEDGTIAAAFELSENLVTKNGVIFASYKRAGDVKTGTVGT